MARLAGTWLARLARDRDGRLAVNGPLKLVRDPRVITWYQQHHPWPHRWLHYQRHPL